MPRLYAVAFVLCLSISAPAAMPFPDSPPPRIGIAKMGNDEKIGIVERMTRHVNEERVRTVTTTRLVDGEEVREAREVTYSVLVPVIHEFKRFVKPQDYKVRDVAGDPITTERLVELLKESTVVLIVEGESKLDRFYAKLYRPDTVVIYLKDPAPMSFDRKATY